MTRHSDESHKPLASLREAEQRIGSERYEPFSRRAAAGVVVVVLVVAGAIALLTEVAPPLPSASTVQAPTQPNPVDPPPPKDATPLPPAHRPAAVQRTEATVPKVAPSLTPQLNSATCEAQVKSIRRLEFDPRFDNDASIRRRWSEQVDIGMRMGCEF